MPIKVTFTTLPKQNTSHIKIIVICKMPYIINFKHNKYIQKIQSLLYIGWETKMLAKNK